MHLETKSANTNITTYGKIVSESGQGITVKGDISVNSNVSIETHDYIYGYNHGIGVEANGVVNIVTHDSVIGQNSYYWSSAGSRMISPDNYQASAISAPSHIYEGDDLWGINSSSKYIEYTNQVLIGGGLKAITR